ncbi:hypothetical protein HY643_04075 [Candidatus Woesearchaeota archaeon]|nr:hypothetical protein [Candidatus Woesearchaeota archaeon]
MPVIGFNLDKISGERKSPLKKDINIKTDMHIKDIKKEDINLGAKTSEVARFEFEFSIVYEPKYADILIGGHILYAESDEKIKEILANWKKSKKIDEGLKLSLLNAILIKCNIKALLISQELGLPPPIRMPKLSSQPVANTVS